MQKTNFKKGGVSMFIVLITCTLVALLVASFVRLVSRDISNASRQDLSQSAYDSAQAGVEDAKRFMTQYFSRCEGLNRSAAANSTSCDNVDRQFGVGQSGNCNVMGALGVGAASGETTIQTSNIAGPAAAREEELNQAYTCVKIQKNSPDYLAKLEEGESRDIRLRTVPGSSIGRVVLQWYSKDNVSGDFSNLNISNDGNIPKSNWPGNRPPVMKVQFYGFNGGGIDDLDGSFSESDNQKTGVDERMYYPVIAGTSLDALPRTRRQTGGTFETTKVGCRRDLSSAQYSCRVEITLGVDILPQDLAYMRVTPLYAATDIKVELKNGAGAATDFDGVQAIVDSTGRANDRLRRVESRIEADAGDSIAPNFAVQVDGSDVLCKKFWVTNNTSGDFACLNP